MGFSTENGLEFSIELFSEDTSCLIEGLGIEGCNIAGWSMGAFIAQETALNRPEITGRLVLLAASCGGDKALWPDEGVWNSLTDLSGTMDERSSRMCCNLFPEKWLRDCGDALSCLPEVKSPVKDSMIRRQSKILKTYRGTYSRLSRIKNKTLIVAGTHDNIIPLENAYILGKAIKNSSVMEINEGGHGFFYQYPDRIARAIIDFLD